MNLKKGTITVPPGEPEAVQHIRFVIRNIVSYHLKDNFSNDDSGGFTFFFSIYQFFGGKACDS